MVKAKPERPVDYEFLFTKVCGNIYIFANFLTGSQEEGSNSQQAKGA